MTPQSRQDLFIPVTAGEDYQTGLARRLHEYGITQRELADEMDVWEHQMSRWVNGIDGKPVSIGIENVVRIEQAILAIRKRKERERRKAEKGKK